MPPCVEKWQLGEEAIEYEEADRSVYTSSHGSLLSDSECDRSTNRVLQDASERQENTSDPVKEIRSQTTVHLPEEESKHHRRTSSEEKAK